MYGNQKCKINKEAGSSLRAELFGILASLICLESIKQLHKIKKTPKCNSYTAYVDNKETVTRANQERKALTRKKDIMRPEFNVEQDIVEKLKTLEIEGKWEWVKAHTESQTEPHQINRKTDELATEAHNLETELRGDEENPLPKIWYKANEISNLKVKKMIDQLSANYIEIELRKRKVSRVDQSSFLDSAFGNKIDSQGGGIGRFVRKIMWGVLPVRQKGYATKIKNDKKCPRCKAEIEDVDHMISCGYKNINKCKDNFKKELINIDTAPDIRTLIQKMFTHPRNSCQEKNDGQRKLDN